MPKSDEVLDVLMELHRPAGRLAGRAVALLLALCALTAGAACTDDKAVGNLTWGGFSECPGPQFSSDFTKPNAHEVDLLFVIDNSLSMSPEQTLLNDQFGALMQELRVLGYRMPDMHIGVTSTDLGMDPYVVEGCAVLGGDEGRLLRRGDNCDAVLDHNYIVDVQPLNCDITRDEDDFSCVTHNCGGASCAHEPTTSLVEDANGCPRCVNYRGGSLEEAFRCVALVGISGCGFEQPLEAMKRALDDNPYNAGFLREESYLAVVLISDEDDCSTHDGSTLFDPTNTEVNSPLGPLSSFRCFEFGFACEPADAPRTELGMRTSCVALDGPGSLLVPIDHYVGFLDSLREREQLMVAAIAGPVLENNAMEVIRDQWGNPYMGNSCSMGIGEDGAYPAMRLHAFVKAFNPGESSDWAFASSCSSDYTETLGGIGSVIRAALDARCPVIPLQGCSDPGAAIGQPIDDRTCNDHCEAQCSITEYLNFGQPGEVATEVPPCLEVCLAGPCPGNDQPALAYAGGAPEQRDPSLPVEACWHVAHNPACAGSRGAEVLIARRFTPILDPVTEVLCQMSPATEQCCYDGIDNDADCLVDLDDPDCEGESPPGWGPDPPRD